MNGSPTAKVPVGDRWRWAKLQAKVTREGGAPPQRWTQPGEAGSVLTAVGYWLYMLRWTPLTNGHAVIVASRTRFGKSMTLFVSTVAIAAVVGLTRRWLPVGAAAALMVFPWVLGNVVHTMLVWPAPGRRHTHLANLVRHPTAARGTGLDLFLRVVSAAADRGDTVTLRTTEDDLVNLYGSHGFDAVGDPGPNGVLMTLPPP